MMQPTNAKEKQTVTHCLSVLLTPGFIIGLGLLLLNDFLLKSTFHNWFTGKLSDFAGLFILPIFLVSFMPRLKRPIYFTSAIVFLLWKSPYARPLIDLWNHYLPLKLGREEDSTDAVALLIMPLSYFYLARVPTDRKPSRPAICVACLLSIFAFTATSLVQVEQTYSNEYFFPIRQRTLIDRIEAFHKVTLPGEAKMTRTEVEKIKNFHRTTPSTYEIWFEAGMPERATVVVSEDKGQAKISLMKIRGRGKPNVEKWRMFFEKEFIEPLKDDVTPTSSKVHSIWLQRG